MYVDLPKDIHAGDVPLFDGEKPIVKLASVKDGALLFELGRKSLIGQVFFDKRKKTATVSIADGNSFIVAGGKKFTVRPIRDFPYRYDIFGNCANYAYTVFEYAPKTIQPIVSAKVIGVPNQKALYSVYLNEDTNIIRNLLIAVAVNGIISLK